MTTASPAIASSPIAQSVATAAKPPREAGLDALRAAMVLLVVFHHTAITYGGAGSWFYREVLPDDSIGSKLLLVLNTVDQAFFMGLLFLLAGYFTPGSVARHGAWRYAGERLRRLGIPILVFGFVLGPASIALAQTAKGKPFVATLLKLWGRGTFEIGPPWFILALLNFSLVYLAWRWFASRVIAAPGPATPRSFPSNSTLAIAALATGAAAFALRLEFPVGSTIGLSLQLGYFASYVVLFAAGCIGASSHWLSNVPRPQRRAWSIVACIALPTLFVLLSIAPRVPALQGSPLGGWTVPAAVYAFWEPLVAWGIIMGLVHAFGRRFSQLSPIWTALTRRSYAIYIIHPPVLVGVALAWRDVPAPPLIKFAVTGAVACLACFLIAGLLLRVPKFDTVL
jgi:peptidoglycan/LPS O-acetylase OafA/YrhL